MNTLANNLDSILPEILKLESSDWNDFFDKVYAIFAKDFIETKPLFRGQRIGFKKHPEYNGKSATFWHMVSEGKDEEERNICTKRCERIGWVRPIIENSFHNELIVWVEKKGNEDRVHLLFSDEKYMVVLNKRRGFWLIWTAFYIDYEHSIKKYYRRFERNKDNEIPL